MTALEEAMLQGEALTYLHFLTRVEHVILNKNFVLIAEKRLRYFDVNRSEGGARRFWSKN